jgi:hypothetical protein
MKKVLLVLFFLGISYIQVHSQELKSKKYEKSIQVLYGNANDFFYRNNNDGKNVEAQCDSCTYHDFGLNYIFIKEINHNFDFGGGIGLSYLTTLFLDIKPWLAPEPFRMVNLNLPLFINYRLGNVPKIGLEFNGFHHLSIMSNSFDGKVYNTTEFKNFGAELYTKIGLDFKNYYLDFSYRIINYDKYFGDINGWNYDIDKARWLNPRKWRIGLGYNF